jgi:hypothetical protein
LYIPFVHSYLQFAAAEYVANLPGNGLRIDQFMDRHRFADETMGTSA